MSVCDTCPQPGHCCRSIVLGGGSFAKHCTTADEFDAYMRDCNAGVADIHPIGPPMPFRPLFRRSDGVWALWCPNLSPAGRCLDYENRPFCCSHYEPKTDALCVLTEAA